MSKSFLCPDIERHSDCEGVSAKACSIIIVIVCTKLAVIRAVSLSVCRNWKHVYCDMCCFSLYHSGVGMFLKSKNPNIKVVLADPQVQCQLVGYRVPIESVCDKLCQVCTVSVHNYIYIRQ